MERIIPGLRHSFKLHPGPDSGSGFATVTVKNVSVCRQAVPRSRSRHDVVLSQLLTVSRTVRVGDHDPNRISREPDTQRVGLTLQELEFTRYTGYSYYPYLGSVENTAQPARSCRSYS
eukprot:3039523-Rhodomonas_salina.1